MVGVKVIHFRVWGRQGLGLGFGLFPASAVQGKPNPAVRVPEAAAAAASFSGRVRR